VAVKNKPINSLIEANPHLSDKELYQLASDKGLCPPSLGAIAIRRYRLGIKRSQEEAAELCRKARSRDGEKT
jgi:hypothetical protein